MSPHVDRRTKVVVIDPMPLARKALTDALQDSARVEVLAAFSGAVPASRRLDSLRPDVVLLDVQRPLEAEIEALLLLQAARPVRFVLFSTLAGGDRRRVEGALSVVAAIPKPLVNLVRETFELRSAIEAAVCKAHDEDRPWQRRDSPPIVHLSRRLRIDPPVIAIGASTGGTEAIATVLTQLPGGLPGMLIVQHMPGGFTHSFAGRLNGLGAATVTEAVDGEPVRPGHVLLAPGGYQMVLARSAEGYVVRVGSTDRVNGHCPSIDVLMHSVAGLAGHRAVGVLLTGMGTDGATGMRAIRTAGGGTVAQDEATSIVYGMPRAAIECGGAAHVAPISQIAGQIARLVEAVAGTH